MNAPEAREENPSLSLDSGSLGVAGYAEHLGETWRQLGFP